MPDVPIYNIDMPYPLFDPNKDHREELGYYHKYIVKELRGLISFLEEQTGKKMDYDKLIADCNKVLELNPDNAEAYSWRGLAHVNKKKYDEAIVDYDKAIELNPDDAETYRYRGLAYESKNNYDKAIAEFLKVSFHAPEMSGHWSDPQQHH